MSEMQTQPDLVAALAEFPSDSPLVFVTDAGRINGGYHVTELKHARINGIDCGGHRSEWDEVSVQILDGGMGPHMAVGKLLTIVEKSLAAMPELADAPVHVEFAPGNIGLRRYGMAAAEGDGEEVIVRLSEQRATCKLVERKARALAADEAGAGDEVGDEVATGADAEPDRAPCCGASERFRPTAKRAGKTGAKVAAKLAVTGGCCT